MSRVTTDAKRIFWQIAVRHVAFLHDQGFSSGVGFFADRFAELTGKAGSLREEFREDWDEITYDAFQQVEERRRSFHDGERSLHLRRLSQKMRALPEGDPKAQLALSDLDHSINRQVFRKAKHDTSECQLQELRDVRDETVVELDAYCLSPGELDDLGRRALEAARHGIALQVLDEVSHYLGGYEAYDSDQRKALPSPSDIADAVQAEYPDRPRDERVDIGMREYKLDSSYNGNTDERHIRKALHEAFRRREE